MEFLKDLREFADKNKNKLKATTENRFTRVLEDDSQHWLLCLVACDLAYTLKIRLPDHLHNRMILGEPNEYTRAYIKFIGLPPENPVPLGAGMNGG